MILKRKKAAERQAEMDERAAKLRAEQEAREAELRKKQEEAFHAMNRNMPGLSRRTGWNQILPVLRNEAGVKRI